MWLALLIFLVIFFTFCSAFFSLAQISLFSLSKPEIKIFQSSKENSKRAIVYLLSRPQDLLVTLLFCDILANILVQNTIANIFSDFNSWWLTVGIPLAITLLFGEIFPKSIALEHKNKVAAKIAIPIAVIHRLIAPIRLIMTSITSRISRFMFFFLKREKEISVDELHHVLKASESQGILNYEESELIDGYLSLQLYSVKELMHPRGEIIFYDTSEPISKLIQRFSDRMFSRIPVCKNDIQNIQGVIHANLFFINQNEIKKPEDIYKYIKPPFYVPETTSGRNLLKQLQLKNEHMAIVVDEYGSIAGLITIEDLYEIVFGEILQKKDQKAHYTPAGMDVIIASGKLELSEFEDIFHVSLPTTNNMVTIGGWLTEQLGDIPKSGTRFQWKHFLFQVLSADKKRVRRVYIRKLKTEAHDA